MAIGNTDFTTVITSTLQNHGNEIFDNVVTNNALLYLLKQAGNIKVVSGGRDFTHPVFHTANSSYAAYGHLETIATPNTDNFSRAVYGIKTIAGSMVLSTLELAQNAGSKEKLLDLAKIKKKEAEISMAEIMGDQVWKDGSVTNDFDGLQNLISISPSTQTTVGNITGVANTYWRNQVDTAGVTAFNTSNEGLTAMSSMVNSCTFGRQGPKAVLTTKTIYALYEIGLTSNIRYQRTDLADAGFRHLSYTTMPVLFDDNATAGNIYFVDTDSLKLQVLSKGNMAMTGFEFSHNQLSKIALMYLFGNLTCGSRRTQGVITTVA